MAPNSQSPGDYDSPSSSQIPLQDLSRPDDPTDERGRGRANSAGGGIFSRPSMMRAGPRSQYQSLAEDSPIDTVPASRNPFQQPANAREEDVAHHNLGDLAQAMSFGFSFDEPYSRSSAADFSASHDFNDAASDLDNVPLDTYHSHDPDHYAPYPPPTDAEDARLTDPRWLQPISGASASDGRPSNDNSTGGSRLGDDLPHIEEGLGRGHGSSARSRSLSPSATGGALQRASSMVKSMSQRVVNLSNEPEVVQQSIEREESNKNARMDGPPVLPAMVDFDQESSTQAQQDRAKRDSAKVWKHRNNPFRGRSLGILGPNHPLRLWLCDILVHPFMEPFVLVIIIIQTCLLIAESSKSVFDKPIAVRWAATPLDWVFLIIFIIYTLEISAKILVSGFIFNPPEYSTLNRSLGIRKAVAEKGRNLITPHRQQTTTKKVSFLPTEPQSSIIRTFTGLNGLDTESYDDPLQKRRIRLAHRAFLRHSFNRLDFVAIIAFWISFFLSLEGMETTHQLYIFKMLSCLRILRLLALTNGTSVRDCLIKQKSPNLLANYIR